MMHVRGTSEKETGEAGGDMLGANTSAFLVFFQKTKLKGKSPDDIALGW